MRILVPLLLVLWALLAVVALAEEPCRYDENRTRVSCTFDAFATIKQKCIGFETDSKVCSERLAVAEQGRLDAADALKKCVASIPPPRSMLKPRLGYAFAVLGSGALTAAAVSNGDAANRFALGAGGLLSLVAGYWLLQTP